MGFLSSCNADSAISTCDTYNFDCTQNPNRPFKIQQFSYSDLHSSTNGFSETNFLGKGSHGYVYKASLNNGKLIAAVKKTTVNTPGENEIEILSRVRSPRLVNLLGFAVDSRGSRLIVVEFMPNGTLHDVLHGSSTKPPGWKRRLRFALQVAKAVQHLHSSNPQVIHRDIKSTNVLIDGNCNARLGDFGLALRGHVEDVKVKCTPPAGTLGYLDPCYLAPGDLSAKSDVFSFGILLLEIISGRNAIDVDYSPPSVVDWAVPLIKSGDYVGICDPKIGAPENGALVRQLAILAARCVRSTAEKRPAMSDVVESLRLVRKRMASPVWNSLRGRAERSQQVVKYEPLDESIETIKVSRGGSRRNRKVSSVPGIELGGQTIDSNSDRVARSKSIGSVNEIKFSPLDSNLGRKKVGLAAKVPTIRLRKSRSTGVLQGRSLVDNNDDNCHVVKNPNGRELEESKLLIDLGKEPKKGD